MNGSSLTPEHHPFAQSIAKVFIHGSGKPEDADKFPKAESVVENIQKAPMAWESIEKILAGHLVAVEAIITESRGKDFKNTLFETLLPMTSDPGVRSFLQSNSVTHAP